MKKSFGELIRETRQKKGITMEALANETEISLTYLYKIEKQDDIPTKEIVINLCRALDLNINKTIDFVIKSKIVLYEKHLRKLYDR